MWRDGGKGTTRSGQRNATAREKGGEGEEPTRRTHGEGHAAGLNRVMRKNEGRCSLPCESETGRTRLSEGFVGLGSVNAPKIATTFVNLNDWDERPHMLDGIPMAEPR